MTHDIFNVRFENRPMVSRRKKSTFLRLSAGWRAVADSINLIKSDELKFWRLAGDEDGCSVSVFYFVVCRD